jgi:hypothetical protein
VRILVGILVACLFSAGVGALRPLTSLFAPPPSELGLGTIVSVPPETAVVDD